MKHISFFLLILTIVFLSGCATKYRHKGLFGGYSETRIGKDEYSVRFQGNGYCSADKAGDFCLLRCAELARNDGYPYFKVVSNNERAIVDYGEKMRNHLDIKMYKEEPAGDQVYEAEYMIRSMKSKYHLKRIKAATAPENSPRSAPYE